MINITKQEADAVRAKYGAEVSISITNRQKRGGRKKYYLPEEPKFLGFIGRLRSRNKQKGGR